MLKLTSYVLGLALILAAGQASAKLIVDTGVPDGTGNLVVDASDWLAGEFNLSAAQSTITDIKWYLDQATSGDQFSIALYGNTSNNKPDTTAELFRGNAVYSDTGWNGLSGLNWTLSQGSYWVALEVLSPGISAIAPTTVSNHLSHTAFNDGGFAGYQAMPLGFGLQIQDSAAVPIPGAFWLFGAALASLSVIRKRRAV